MNDEENAEEAIDELILDGVIKSSKERKCSYYATAFYEKANEARKDSKDKEAELLELFGAATSLALKPEFISHPFSAAIILDNSRSAILEDFDEAQLETLFGLVTKISDAELRSRIADILWTRKHDYKMAELAIDSYLESASVIEDPKKWSSGFTRIERASRLAKALNNESKQALVISHVEEIIQRNEGEDPLYFSERLMKILIDQSVGDAEYYSGLSRKIAEKAEEKAEWSRARAYYEIEAVWHNRADNNESEKKAKLNAAETYVNESEVAKNNSFGVAASILQKAIEAFRRIGNMDERIITLHSTMLVYQKNSLEEMQSISVEIDISKEVEMATNRVKGLPFHEALFELAKMIAANAPTKTQLKREAEEKAVDHPLQYFLERTSINEKGKVVNRVPSPIGGDEIAVAEALKANMFEQLGLHHSSCVSAVINPIRRQINLEHQVHIRYLLDIVKNNPLVPEGREYLFARGLYAGFENEFEVAVSILLPQFENAIRHLLEQRGSITSSLSSPDGIQEEGGLNKTLNSDEITEIFGENTVFELQGLLDDRLGANLRNRFAHGLMSHRDFFSADVVYFWGLVLRFCCWPYVIQSEEQRKKDDKEQMQPTDNMASDIENEE